MRYDSRHTQTCYQAPVATKPYIKAPLPIGLRADPLRRWYRCIPGTILLVLVPSSSSATLPIALRISTGLLSGYIQGPVGIQVLLALPPIPLHR